MKLIAIWSGIAAVAFVAMGIQMGTFRSERPRAEEDATAEVKPAAPLKVVAKFPEDLAPAARARPVPAAAAYNPGPDPHPMLLTHVNGMVHTWQELIREDWAAESVATTELVVVIGTPRKSFVSHHTYANNAPPITRWLFELEISVIEAKTGKILANRLFRNEPRMLQPVEAWATTMIGRSVSVQQVFNWVSKTSRLGFPEAHNSNPITTQVD